MLKFIVFFLCLSYPRVPPREVVVVFQDQADQPVAGLVVRVSLPNATLTLTTNEKGQATFKTHSKIVLFDLMWEGANSFYSLPDTYHLEEERNLLTIRIERSRIPGNTK